MKGITSTNLAELEAINKKINDWMIANVEGYVGTQWGMIKEHPTVKGTYILVINEDSRNPLDKLTLTEKTRCIEHDVNEWFPKQTI